MLFSFSTVFCGTGHDVLQFCQSLVRQSRTDPAFLTSLFSLCFDAHCPAASEVDTSLHLLSSCTDAEYWQCSGRVSSRKDCVNSFVNREVKPVYHIGWGFTALSGGCWSKILDASTSSTFTLCCTAPLKHQLLGLILELTLTAKADVSLWESSCFLQFSCINTHLIAAKVNYTHSQLNGSSWEYDALLKCATAVCVGMKDNVYSLYPFMFSPTQVFQVSLSLYLY